MLSVTRKRRLNKRGSLFDYIDIMPQIFIGLVVTVLAIFMFQQINGSGAFDRSTEAQDIANTFENDQIGTLDLISIMAFFGLFLGSLLLAFSLPTNPSLFWINILLLTILMFLAVALSNTWETIEAVSQLATATGELTITGFLMDKLPLLTAIYGVVLIVVMLAVKRVSQEEGGVF